MGHGVDDDGQEGVPQLANGAPDFLDYGADLHGAQRERRADDPHVHCDPPIQLFLSPEGEAYVPDLAASMPDTAENLFDVDKFLYLVGIVRQLMS